ncbi:MAG: UxaA family hydrolase [Deltaproteobacteria bacterium]|nr:UxaA family hydrolase [Deltaproteobacteria bacterium]
MRRKKELHEVAVLVDPVRDNVAVLHRPVRRGLRLFLGDAPIVVRQSMNVGDRMTIVEIGRKRPLVQFGVPFATSHGLQAGEKITSSNTSDKLPVKGGRLAPVRPARNHRRMPASRTFSGFPRQDGSCGTRNYFVVLPTSMCASEIACHVAETVSREGDPAGFDGVLALSHTEGCGCAGGEQIERVLRVMKNILRNPNVGGALLVDLGCEQTNRTAVDRHLKSVLAEGRLVKPLDWLTIQAAGGSRKAVDAGVSRLNRMLPEVRRMRRTPCPVGKLVIGVECGASDAFSGITANRVIGNAVDRVINTGGSAVLSEIPETIGAEALLYPRMRSRAVLEKYREGVRWYRSMALRMGAAMRDNLVPENRTGGLINPSIKSIGAVMKGGSSVIQDFLQYGEKVRRRGLSIMQGPGNDLESVTGLAATGVNLICFSTGRGTVTGCAVVPVVKISSTTRLFEQLREDIDFDGGRMLGERNQAEAIERYGGELLEKVLAVASGERSRPEIAGQRQFQIWSAGKLSL